MLELFPRGFEEVERDGGVELAAYTDAAGEERLWHVFGGAASAEVEDGWEERWRDVPPAGARRPALGRPAVGDAAERRARRRRRPRPRVRHRRAPDDAALPRAAAGARAGLAARRRLRLRRARDRRGAARLRAGARASTSRRRRSRRRARTPPRTASRSTPSLVDAREDAALRQPTSSSRTSRSPAVAALAAEDRRADVLVTSGYLDADEPRLPGYERVERRELDGWAADLHRTT